jgi:hypothetical protein
MLGKDYVPRLGGVKEMRKEFFSSTPAQEEPK